MWLHSNLLNWLELGLRFDCCSYALHARRERNLAETARHQGGFAVVPKLTEQSNEDQGGKERGRRGRGRRQGRSMEGVHRPSNACRQAGANWQGQLPRQVKIAHCCRGKAGKVMNPVRNFGKHWWLLVAARGGRFAPAGLFLVVSVSVCLGCPNPPPPALSGRSTRHQDDKAGAVWHQKKRERGSNMAPPSLAEVTIVWIQ